MNGYHIFALVDSRDYGCLHNLVDGDMMAVVSFSIISEFYCNKYIKQSELALE